MLRMLLALVPLVVSAGCTVALRPVVTVGSAPPNCVWMQGRQEGEDDTIYLCCAEELNAKPLCREAVWE